MFVNVDDFKSYRTSLAQKLSLSFDERAPVPYMGQYLALFYKTSWQSRNVFQYNTDLWGQMPLNQERFDVKKSNYFLHIELEYRVTTAETNLKLHLETNPYFTQKTLNQWAAMSPDNADWLQSFRKMKSEFFKFFEKEFSEYLKNEHLQNKWIARQGDIQIARYCFNARDEIVDRVHYMLKFLELKENEILRILNFLPS